MTSLPVTLIPQPYNCPYSLRQSRRLSGRVIKMALKLATTARKLKVTIVIDAAPFAALRAVPDNAPSRTDITVTVGGRTVFADLATRSVRKVVKTLADHGADNVIPILQGVLTSNDRIEEAGLAAQVKAAEPQSAA